ncbi:Mor transcription activator family protein [Craterilacuibacter sinensis]|nr:Mor transcription activator family protein [Craterilacuibacter sinensis]
MKLDDVTELLPESIRDIAQLIGFPAALALVQAMGGTTFKVPKGRTPEGIALFQWVSEIIGQREAGVIARHYGGSVIYIPRCYDALLELRDRELRARFDSLTTGQSANISVRELAGRFKLADRTIWRILKRPSRVPDPTQPSLF